MKKGYYKRESIFLIRSDVYSSLKMYTFRFLKLHSMIAFRNLKSTLGPCAYFQSHQVKK